MTEEAPLTGYNIVGVFNTTAELKVRSPEEFNLTTEESMNFSWDWRAEETDIFDVRLAIAVNATKARPYSAMVDAVGRFQRLKGEPSVTLADFVKLQAVAILMPYVRQFLSALTQNTPAGPFFLPPINVVRIMERMDPAKATGAGQLIEKTSEFAMSSPSRGLRRRSKASPTRRRK